MSSSAALSVLKSSSMAGTNRRLRGAENDDGSRGSSRRLRSHGRDAKPAADLVDAHC